LWRYNNRDGRRQANLCVREDGLVLGLRCSRFDAAEPPPSEGVRVHDEERGTRGRGCKTG
jgi:hypothetical protein